MRLAEWTALKPMTAVGLLALPDDGVERDLIRGELRERSKGLRRTRRNPMRSETEMLIGHELLLWLETQPISRGKVVRGEAGVRLKIDPVTFVGIDVADVSPEMAANHDKKRKYFDGLQFWP